MEQYIVITLAKGTAPPYEDCQIVPADGIYDATHRQSFGPATKADCEAWVAANREKSDDAGGDAAARGDVGANPQNGAFKLAPWWSYVLIAAAMGLLLYLTGEITKSVFESRAQGLTNPFKMTPSNSNSASNANTSVDAAEGYKVPPACTIATPQEKQTFILRQRQQVVAYGDGHLQTAIAFGAYFYANVAILAIFGFISLISLALITKNGLANASGVLVAVFLLSTGIGLTYQGFVGVFQQKGNVDTNAALSVEYGKLVDEIDTYCTTGKVAISDPKDALAALAASGKSGTASPTATAPTNPETAGSKKSTPNANTDTTSKPTVFYVALEPDNFILYLDWKIKSYRKYSVAFDDKPVSSFTDTTRMPNL